jgi:uncharacterized protein (DUF1800 family)
MVDDRALVAHLLRRTGFGPQPGAVEELAAGGVDAAVEAVLATDPLDPGEPSLDDESEDDYDEPVRHWLGLMCRPEAGLHEKLTWFWHGHLTSSYDKVGSWKMMWQQHRLLREHALGNFRDLLQAVTVDPAMLTYLDGDGSSADAPNENHSRELTELFALGRGQYSQDDVAAGAVALSGWWVDWDAATADFDSEAGPPRPVTYLGRRGVADAAAVIDAVCDHPACPGHVVGALHRFLAGVYPEPARRDELARLFADGGLEIRPVVEAIVRHPSFLDLRLNRPRYPVEWVAAAIGAYGYDDTTLAEHDTDVGLLAYETCAALNQTPFYPPNVAGWPPGPRWLAPTYAAGRASLVWYLTAAAPLAEDDDPLTAVLDRCSLYEVSPRTRSALEQAARQLADADDPAGADATLLGLAVASPEFALA